MGTENIKEIPKLKISSKGIKQLSQEYKLDISVVKEWLSKIHHNLLSVIGEYQRKVKSGETDVIVLRDVREEAFSMKTPFLDTLYDFCTCIKGYDDAVADYMEKVICSLHGYESMRYCYPWDEGARNRYYQTDEDYIRENYNSILFKKKS